MSQLDVRVRPAAEGDLPGILDIYNDAILNTTATFDTEPKTLEDRRQWFRETVHPYVVIVADCADAVGGWASLRPFGSKPAYRFTTEDSVYVRADLRGNGVGRLLLARLLEIAIENGFHSVIARIAAGNPASDRLHLALGFQSVGVEREVGFKFERWLDVAVLQRLLGEGTGPVLK